MITAEYHKLYKKSETRLIWSLKENFDFNRPSRTRYLLDIFEISI
jgi:hypothetical protein